MDNETMLMGMEKDDVAFQCCQHGGNVKEKCTSYNGWLR